MRVTINRISSQTLELIFDEIPKDHAKLYWSHQPTTEIDPNNFITSEISKILTVHDPLEAKQRIYFILQQGNQCELFAERTLPIEGLNNFRDIGGYIGAQGKKIKWGVLYRSNHLFNLSHGAIDYLKQLKISSIIDYRSQNEINKSPNCDIGEKHTFHLDATAQTAELAAQFAADPSDEDKALIDSIIRDIPKELINGDGKQIIEQYRQFVVSEKSKTAFRKMIQVLLDSNNSPSIQHCRGGKDRTGYGVLLVLVMLGVSEETIIYDYMLTHFNRLARNEVKMKAYREITQEQNVLDYLLSLIDTRESFIIEVFNSMKQVSGTVENYIINELGFSHDDFKKMQSIYLE